MAAALPGWSSRPVDGAALVADLRAVAGGAYGPGWEDRGRSGLAVAALLLAALWPSGGPAAAQGSSVYRVRLRRRLPHGHISAAKAAIMAGVVIAGIAGCHRGQAYRVRGTATSTHTSASNDTGARARAVDRDAACGRAAANLRLSGRILGHGIRRYQ
ncbi:MAG: hypothetical protein ACRDOL_18790 [Streptosporangiaceae bacterium]